MRYSKEIKVGLSLILSVVVFVLGIRLFEDLPLFRGTQSYYSTFEDASGILPGNSVRISGVRVGSVDAVELDPETANVRVDFHVDEGVAIPEGSTAEISGIAALNSVYLQIHLGPASNPGIAEGGLVPSLGEATLLGQLTDQAPALIGRIDTLLASASGTFQATDRLLTSSEADVHQTLAAFRSTAVTLDQLLRAERDRLARTLANAERFSSDLTAVASDLRAFGDENSDSLRLAFANLNSALARLDRNMAALESSTATLDDVLGKIDRGEGTLGRLINDPALYAKLDSAVTGLNTLVTDFQQNPGRYLRDLRLVDIF